MTMWTDCITHKYCLNSHDNSLDDNSYDETQNERLDQVKSLHIEEWINAK
jgi:hypothetical protein